MQLITVMLLSFVCMAQAGLLGGIVDRDESDRPELAGDNTPSQSVGLLSGVGGIPYDNDGDKDHTEGTAPLLLAGIGGISTGNQGASQLALRDSLRTEDDSSDDDVSEDKAEAEVRLTK
jgi:hypothetical protein